MCEIVSTEVPKLRACLESLAEHHNAVSNNFKGKYPSRPYENTLKLFEEALINKTSRIAVAEEQGCIVGFCKIDICAEGGRIDYIVILKEHRGKGCGKLLMDWACSCLKNMIFTVSRSRRLTGMTMRSVCMKSTALR